MEVNLAREEKKLRQQKDGAEVNMERACDSPASEPSRAACSNLWNIYQNCDTGQQTGTLN
jgi:hypothetical protein